jgi:DNA invertase Pin-like site-specific DNA recombinase
MLIGYARVSKIDQQDTTAQESELKKAGCTKIFHEAMSAGSHKPKLQEAISHLREGDVLVVWKLDRLSRSFEGSAIYDGEDCSRQCRVPIVDRAHGHHDRRRTDAYANVGQLCRI